ncbi:MULTISPECIES: hypothetical protein [Zhongshania]|jgi:hypothetical protein|uniref:Uncharacterized protein n=1 Tax=Zhongshania antarctica TaxID=641702 RepID=A0A840R3X1_9GAMM|nr:MULTISPECIES: hypothetical protein [Zhongshania]MBB5187845.1 hypothetical protein [Zhongshania antarctica]
MKQLLIGTTLTIFAGLLVACADDKAASAPAAEKGSTAVSIDTGEGSFSFKSDSDGENTSVSVDADGGDEKSKK